MIIEGKFFIYFFVWFDSEKNKKIKNQYFLLNFKKAAILHNYLI